MNEKVARALSYVDERYISAAARRKRKKRILPMAVAAALTLAFFLNLPGTPLILTAGAVATASGSQQTARPDSDDYEDHAAWRADLDEWETEQTLRSETTAAAMEQLTPFFAAGSVQFLGGGNGENRLWSPVNAYIGLSMLTELTAGESQKQILALFGAADTDELRRQVSAVWESTYRDRKGHEKSSLANSLWLDKDLSYRQETMDDLAYYYHTSVYRGEPGSRKMDRAIGAWLNSNTGGLLKDAADQIELSPETVLALYSTVYFQAKWSDQFVQKNNTEGVFHAPSGDVKATFMNKKLATMSYYWGDIFSAVSLGLKNGSSMWFILPNEGYTTDDVLSDGQYLQMVLQQNWENKKHMKVNLSVPKFDVSSTADLKDGLQQMGVTDVFTFGSADFSAITGDTPLFLTAANQSVRVQIDEEGVKAAAYIELPMYGSAEPPDEVIDFVVDRPFLFAVTSSSVPLFMGAVQQP